MFSQGNPLVVPVNGLKFDLGHMSYSDRQGNSKSFDYNIANLLICGSFPWTWEN